MSEPSDRPDWARVEAIFHDALEQPASARSAFIDEACGDDGPLRDEVTSLVAAHEAGGDALAPPETAAALPPGHLIGHYRVIDQIGEGGMGIVYRAEDTKLGRVVALKALPARFAVDATRRERLRREARATAALRLPGIAVVYALEEFDDQLYLVSEYVPGRTLRADLEPGPLPIDQVISTGVALARTLAAAHARGIVHRDLKPENLIRSPDGGLTILDFGLAHTLDVAPADRLTRDGAVLGTPAYMAPEQIRHGTVDARSDLFAVGVVLYEAATGSNPFQGHDPAGTLARVLEIAPPGLVAPPDLPEQEAAKIRRLDTIIRTCLSKAPAARYASADDLARALIQAGAGQDPDAAPMTPTPADAREHALWWWGFHQGAASLGSMTLLVPYGLATEFLGAAAGMPVFLAGLVAALTASLLRLHAWFTVRSLADGAGRPPGTRPAIQIADQALAGLLLVTGVLVLAEHREWAVTLVACAVAVSVASAVVEPATARAAFESS